MKLELSVTKRFVTRTSGYVEEVLFAVLDLDKSEEYPANFVCLLPKKLENGCKTVNFSISLEMKVVK